MLGNASIKSNLKSNDAFQRAWFGVGQSAEIEYTRNAARCIYPNYI